jgi:ABC-type phosphate/phosphonate transport system substrate-binding protein
LPGVVALSIMGCTQQEKTAIKPQQHRNYGIAVLSMLIILTACSRGAGNVAATRALPTSIPASTPLPPLPTVPAVGSDENPLVILMIVPDASAAEDAAASLSNALSEETDLTFDVQVSDSYSVAHQALCGRTAVAVALDAFTYLAARQEGCGTAEYVLEKDGQTQTQGQFLANDVFRPELYRGVFCRTEPESLNGWIVPTLTLRARGVNAFTDFYDIIDVGSDEDVVRKIHDGECSLGATSLGAELTVSGLTRPERLHVLEALEPVPNDVLVISDLVDPSIRDGVLEALAEFTAEAASLMGGDSLQPIEDTAFNGLRGLFSGAGVDPSAIGR